VKLGLVPLDVVALFFTVNVFTSGKNFRDVQGECVPPLAPIQASRFRISHGC
jgi:hypothetical protein